jgi:hypothetical protein
MRIVFNSSDSKIVQAQKSSLAINLTNEIPVNEIQILNIQIPYSFYNVNKYNNVINLKWLSGEELIIIQPGFYNAQQLIKQLETQIKSFIGGVTFSYNTQLNKFSFNCTDVSVKMNFLKRSYILFGVTQELDFSINPLIVASNCVQMNYFQNLFIRSNVSSGNIIYNGHYTNNLCVIPIFSTQPGQMIELKNYTSDFGFSVHRNIGFIELEIVDEYGSIVDLNGCDWSGELNIS